MSRMYDANGLLKSCKLESQLTPKDKETIRSCYRDAMYDADRSGCATTHSTQRTNAMKQTEKIEAGASAYRNNMNRLVAEVAGCEATFDAAIRLAFREGARFALENQWLSVDEETPPTDEDLIVYVPEDNETPTRCVPAYWDGEDWYTTDDEHIRPTHWMQLPKLPETE